MTDDRHDIAALVHAYAERLDAGDLDGVAALFEHATLRSNRRDAVRRGREAARALYHQTVRLYDGSPCTKHVIGNLAIDLAGAANAATARSSFTVLQARPELPLQVILAGRYHDRFVRAEGGWRFAERCILVDLMGDLRWHVHGVR
jgi:3-phenylpropionate/cinnamic acid dioxygenase small subunit